MKNKINTLKQEVTLKRNKVSQAFTLTSHKTSQAFTLTSHKTSQAFTLIEMLVVISLIGILAALALVSFGASQKQARDTTRKSDLKQYQTALEMYGNMTNGLFPSRTSAVPASSTLCSDLNVRLEPDITCSEDPKNSSDSSFVYNYISNGTLGTASATVYVLWSKVENSANNEYWVVCSNGRNGVSSTQPSSSVCPI